jgi:hypothetical protein
MAAQVILQAGRRVSEATANRYHSSHDDDDDDDDLWVICVHLGLGGEEFLRRESGDLQIRDLQKKVANPGFLKEILRGGSGEHPKS